MWGPTSCNFFSNLLMDLDALREGVLRTTNPLDAPMPWVDPRDIAEVAAGRLLHPWEGRGATAVHGPEDLTFAQVADVLTTALGRPVRAERIADDDLRASLGAVGLGEAQVEAIVGMSTGLRDGFVPSSRARCSPPPRARSRAGRTRTCGRCSE